MKRRKTVGGYFVPTGQNTLIFESANNLRNLFFQLFLVMGSISILAEVTNILQGYEPIWRDIFRGKFSFAVVLLVFPFFLPIVGLLLPKVHVRLDRLHGMVHHRQGRRQYAFPWNQITYTHKWFPTKVGGATLFTLNATPPFPDALERWIERKKQRPPPGQAYTFNLGSFDVKGPEHGQAIFAFLDAWMRSREPAGPLYQSMVLSRFEY